MIELILQLPKYRWTVFFHFAVSCYHTDGIVKELRALNVPKKHIDKARRLMENCLLNEGFTYSNGGFGESVVVTELTSSAAEFQNSLQHEIRHLVDDMSIACHITEKEELGYLTGELNREIFPYLHRLLCDGCRRSWN